MASAIVRKSGAMNYLPGDHLGSTSVATSNSGATTNSVRYFAYGSQRSGNLFALPTDHGFTGQKLDTGTGLLYYGTRYYDSGLGMFISPDSIIPSPGNPQDLNRYSYTHNNPLKYNDPTGHNPSDPWHQLGLYNPYESVAMYFGVPDFSQDGVPTYEDLTTDIGKTYTEAFAQASQVINPPINLALNYTPGISAAYQLATAGSGSTIFGEKLSSSERALNGVFAVAGVAPVGKVKVAPEAPTLRCQVLSRLQEPRVSVLL